MKIEVKFGGVSLKAYADKVEQFSRTVMVDATRELNTRGSIMRKGMVPVLAAQTGLKRGTIDRFLIERPASAGTPIYELKGSGGNVSLKYFRPRETAAGVTAAPWGMRKLYPHTFKRAGWWPHRVDKPNWNGQVFLRAGGKTEAGSDTFEKQRSGLYIATEMTKGATLQYFEDSAERMGAAIVTVVTSKLP